MILSSLRSLGFKCPVYQLRRTYTSSEPFHDVRCLILRNIPNLHSTDIFIRLHWRVRGGRRPPQRQDRHPAQRPHQQDRCHLSPLQRPAPRHGEVGCQATPLASIRLHRPHHLCRYHGPRGGPQEARCRKDPWFLLLDYSNLWWSGMQYTRTWASICLAK